MISTPITDLRLAVDLMADPVAFFGHLTAILARFPGPVRVEVTIRFDDGKTATFVGPRRVTACPELDAELRALLAEYGRHSAHDPSPLDGDQAPAADP